MIEIKIYGQNFKFSFSGSNFDKDKELIKRFESRKFHKTGSGAYWSAPITIKNIALIKENKAWFYNANIVDKIGSLKQIKPKENPNVDKLFKMLKLFIAKKIPFLRKYQVKDVATYLITRNILNCNEMGLGKTIETAATIYLMRNYRIELREYKINIPANKVLIICPSSLKRQWQQELKDHFNLESTIIMGTKTQRAKLWTTLNTMTREYIIITNYENLSTDDFNRFKLDSVVFDMIVMDEITKCKTFTTSNYKQCNTLNAKKKIGLTGTPIENHLLDMYSVMSLINPNFFQSYDRFKAKFLRYGGYMNQELVPKEGALEYLSKDLRNFWGFIRWNKESVLKELPETIVKLYRIDLTSYEREEYMRIHKGMARVRGHTGNIDLTNKLSKMQVLLRFCSDPSIYAHSQIDPVYYAQEKNIKSAKKTEFIRVIRDILNGRKIVAFSTHKDIIYNYAQALRSEGIPVITITGKDPIDSRQDIINRFKESSKVNLMLCTDALAYGANLQFCSTLINIDMHWNPAVIKQRIGRIQRIGQKNTPLIVNFCCSDTVEEKVYNRILGKERLFDKIITANELMAECL